MQQYFASGLLALLAVGMAAGCEPRASDPPARAAEASASPAAQADARRVVLFLGDSLSAGYGLRADQAFPALIQQRIDAESLPFRVVNAGVSGDTTAGGLRRLDWLLRQPVDTLVIQLGGNDMLRGLDVGAMRANLRGIAAKLRAAHPDAAIVIAGMRAPSNLGAHYVREYRAAFEELAAEVGGVLIPFLLEGVATRPGLNQPDGIHPTVEGHEIVAETVWGILGQVLRGRS